MIEVYLRAIETRLTDNASAKLVDHWNNQVQFMEQSKQVYPAAYIDFGTIQWSNTMSGMKTGRCLMAVHCANKNTRDTDSKAEDKDGKRLKRFDWSNAVVNALDNYNARDTDGNTIIKTMHIDSSQMDTNHDALTDDVLFFSCTLYYYDTWRGKDWREIVIESISIERIEADTKPDPGLPPVLPPDTPEGYDWDLIRWDEDAGRWVRWHKPTTEGDYAIRRNADGSLEFVPVNVDLDLNADDIDETATRFWLTDALKTAYNSAVTWISNNGANLINHLSNTSNPHNVTKAQVGLGNVDNTSDANKPVSDATQQALDQEAITRLNADNALSSDILAEASARSSADTNILSFVAATYATLASLTSYLTTAAAATTYQVILSAANFGAFINGLSAKTTPVDADAVSLIDSEDSNNAKKLTWANIKATLKTYFDTLYSSPIYSPTAGNTIAEIIDDFAYVTPLSGATSTSHAMTHSGSNVTSITNLISTMTNQLGVVSCQYNGSGDNVWSMSRVAALGQGELCFGCYMRRPNDSGAANRSNLRFGLRFGSGDGTDGVFFKLNEATNSDRWQCITRASSVSTTSNTSVTTAKSSWVRLFIVINAAGTEAKFYIDGTLVATHNTNMPAAGTALTGILNLERTVVSSVITWLIDYFYIKQTFTTPR